MSYFTIDELCHSDTARDYHLNNSPSPEVCRNLEALITQLLDPIRTLYGNPIIVNSGYRCPELNRIVGGKTNSQHLLGMAADISTGKADDNRRLFRLIEGSQLPFDQLIDESHYLWLHVSYNRFKHPRRQVLHI